MMINITTEFLLLTIIFIVWMVHVPTTKQLQKMKWLEQMFVQYEQSGLTVSDFCKKNGIQRSKFYYWRQRYEEQKESGLIDRRKGTAYKVTKDKRNFIVQYKIKNPLSSCKDIEDEFKKKFRTDIHFTWVAQILREEKLNDSVGRKAGKTVKKTRK